MNKDLHTDPGGHSGIHEDLLVKHLLGETAPDENARVEAWLAADPANRHFYEQFQLIWRESGRLEGNIPKTGDQEEVAWQKFRQRIHRPSHLQPIKGGSIQPAGRVAWRRIAAVLILAASITGLLYLFGHQGSPEKKVASNADVLTDTLSDGSIVTLNKQSNITYPEKFKQGERTVRLQGEAFFTIAHNKDQPFKVYTNGITITVLGTSFNVRNKGTTTEIIVETGMVRVKDSLHDIILDRLEKLVIHQGVLAVVRDSNRNELYKYYRTRELVCDNTPLWQLAQKLEEMYDVQITIKDPALQQQKINTTFRDGSLDQILSVIRETFRIQVDRSGNQVIIQP